MGAQITTMKYYQLDSGSDNLPECDSPNAHSLQRRYKCGGCGLMYAISLPHDITSINITSIPEDIYAVVRGISIDVFHIRLWSIIQPHVTGALVLPVRVAGKAVEEWIAAVPPVDQRVPETTDTNPLSQCHLCHNWSVFKLGRRTFIDNTSIQRRSVFYSMTRSLIVSAHIRNEILSLNQENKLRFTLVSLRPILQPM